VQGVTSLSPADLAAYKQQAHGQIWFLTNVLFWMMIAFLLIGLILLFYCGFHYLSLRAAANKRARERIDTARRNGHHITTEVEFIFYNYEYLHTPGEMDPPHMAAFLYPVRPLEAETS
jgi:hypothetical protein